MDLSVVSGSDPGRQKKASVKGLLDQWCHGGTGVLALVGGDFSADAP